MKKIFLLGAILIFASAAQAQRASMVPSPPSNPAPADTGPRSYFTNCLYDDDDYIYVPVEIDPDAPSAQYRPISPPAVSAPAPPASVNSSQSTGGGSSKQPNTFFALPAPTAPTLPLGDVARAYRAQKAASGKSKIVAEQDNSGKIILVPADR